MTLNVVMLILTTILSRQVPVSRKCKLKDHQGWRCNNGHCILREWICDGENQCEYEDVNNPDNSDEEEGCNLFPCELSHTW